MGSPGHEECAVCIPWTGAQKYDVSDGTSSWSSRATNIVSMGTFMESGRLPKGTKSLFTLGSSEKCFKVLRSIVNKLIYYG